MWIDKILYWAWIGNDMDPPPTPTQKTIDYAEINGSAPMKLAVTVWDDDAPTEVNRSELSWHIKHGADAKMPIDLPPSRR